MNNFIKAILSSLINFLKNIKKYSILKICMILAYILILYSRKFYNQYSLLEDVEIKIFSQNGEDDIIDFIVKKIAIIFREIFEKKFNKQINYDFASSVINKNTIKFIKGIKFVDTKEESYGILKKYFTLKIKSYAK
jgi:hypothetical protein